MKMTNGDYRLLLIIWEHEPINSTMLVSLCKEQLGWAKSTTYSVLRRLINRGLVKNENYIVLSQISKEEVQVYLAEKMLEDTFCGSVPDLIQVLSQLRSKGK